MSLFFYPKSKHIRRYKPAKFIRYQTYKKYLQRDFERVCVYCRQPDSSSPNLNFGVDHYRPKGLPQFEHLACEYNNLYYCCGDCNSRKNNYWPLSKNQKHIVNPCDYEMFSHLRFDKKTGKINALTENGEQTLYLLQLNNEASILYRLNTILTVERFESCIRIREKEKENFDNQYRSSKISKKDYETCITEINEEIIKMQNIINAHTGKVPLPPL